VEKPDLQRKAEFERWGPTRLDEPPLSCGEREERFELKLADLAWQLAHAQELRLPRLHRAPPPIRGRDGLA
jgi:hypothetical protein